MATHGVSGMKLYVPRLRVPLERWCEWTKASWDKTRAVVGESFRMRAPHESIYTMAANAVLRLVVDYDVDPARIGYLGFGTESSTDNAAGAVILRGMVDRALRQMRLPSLSRNCEVPEIKHACLGGVYAMKGALRYVATDGRDRQAIVVSADIAEYERGSSGEATQGAGAAAMLVEESPRLFEVELHRGGSASDYRGPDFRKPFRRHFAPGYAKGAEGQHDYPVFSGKYSTVAYIDEVLRAVGHMLERSHQTPRSYYQRVAGVFMHRPYHQMPQNAMAALYTWGLSHDAAHLDELKALCVEAGADFDRVVVEMRSRPNLFDEVEKKRDADHVYTESMKAVRKFRASRKFHDVIASKMSRGSKRMAELGNMYTAALPAWIAAGLDEASGVADDELAGKEILTVGYGSGDAAEAIPIRVAAGWREAARRIDVAGAMAGAIDLTQTQYEAIHDGKSPPDLEVTPSREFVVDRIGETHDADFQDLGVEYYRYVS